MARLHILLDSREQSISCARRFYLRLKQPQLGIVEHIRPSSFSEHFKTILEHASAKDNIFISLHFVSGEQLGAASCYLGKFKKILSKVTFVSFACFDHIEKWCIEHGMNFEPNLFKRRSLDADAENRIKHCLEQDLHQLKDEIGRAHV